MKAVLLTTWLILSLLVQSTCVLASRFEDCPPLDGKNLLQNPRFLADEKGLRDHWTASQHAGTRAYEVSVDNGVLTIKKVDEQAWFAFVQHVEIREHANGRLRFSAEIKLDMSADSNHGFKQGGGLSLAIRGQSSKGKNKLLSRSVLDHKPRLGKTDWTRVAVVVDVPQGAANLKAGFLHQANGTLSVRNPELYAIEKTCEHPSK